MYATQVVSIMALGRKRALLLGTIRPNAVELHRMVVGGGIFIRVADTMICPKILSEMIFS